MFKCLGIDDFLYHCLGSGQCHITGRGKVVIFQPQAPDVKLFLFIVK